MKYLASLLFSLLFNHSINATILCDASCELIISFPEGGSIVADETVLLTFGTDGFINLGATGTVNTNPQPVSTNYATGGMLLLGKGESITFDNDGSLVLGTGGNIEYTAITINSAGGASLTAVENIEEIFINNLTLSGGINLTFSAKTLTVSGNLIIDVNSTLTLIAESDALVPSVCSVHDATSGVTLSTGHINTADNCNTIANNLSLSAGELTVVAIDPNANLITTGSITIVEDPTAVDLNEITIPQDNSNEDGSGANGIYWLLLIPTILFYRRK